MNQQDEKNTYNMRSLSEQEEKTQKTVVQEQASEVAQEVQQQAAVLSKQAKEEAKSSLQAQKEMAAQELHGVAQALRQTGNTLREQDQTLFAQYSNQVADRVEWASTYLEEHDLDELLYEAEDFARRQPELFIGGAFTLGLLAARFLKSTAPPRSSRERTYDTHTSLAPKRPTAVTSSPNQPERYPTPAPVTDSRYSRPRA